MTGAHFAAAVLALVTLTTVGGFVPPSGAIYKASGVHGSSRMIMSTAAMEHEVLADVQSVDGLKKLWPVVAESPEYLAIVARGARLDTSPANLARRAQWANTFARMARTVLLARGPDIIADDFVFYSPSTGILNKDEYMSLVKTLDVAFSDYTVFPKDFTAYADGVVSYRCMWRAVHDGPLAVAGAGAAPVRPTGAKALSDIELNTVAFTNDGKLLAHTTGLRVAGTDAMVDPAMVADIGMLERKIAGQQEKIKSLAGQEHTIAYTKSMEEVENMTMRLETLRAKCDIASNTGSLGGLHALFHAIEVPFPADIKSLFGRVPYDVVEGTRAYGFSVPADVMNYKSISGE